LPQLDDASSPVARTLHKKNDKPFKKPYTHGTNSALETHQSNKAAVNSSIVLEETKGLARHLQLRRILEFYCV
jgi:hypothetical protein